MATEDAAHGGNPTSTPYDLTIDDLVTALKRENLQNLEKTDLWKLFEKRLDYAWNDFEHHAKQRYTGFNFFIIFVGILAGAYSTLFKDGEFPVAIAIGAFAIIIAILFLILDRRNVQLVSNAEDVLCALEKDLLFSNYRRVRKSVYPEYYRDDTATTSARETQLGIQLNEPKSYCRHAIWMPFLVFFVIFGFFLASAAATYQLFTKPETRMKEQATFSCTQTDDAKTVSCTLAVPGTK